MAIAATSEGGPVMEALGDASDRNLFRGVPRHILESKTNPVHQRCPLTPTGTSAQLLLRRKA
eukprot:8444495-Alexandrium_andersonii.AAC.1